jgi:hypothetical protein
MKLLATISLIGSLLCIPSLGQSATYMLGDQPVGMSHQVFRPSAIGDVLYAGTYTGGDPAQIFRSTDGGSSWKLLTTTPDRCESVSGVVEYQGQLYVLTERPMGDPIIYHMDQTGNLAPVASFDQGAMYTFSFDGTGIVCVSNNHWDVGGYLGSLHGDRLTTDMWIDGKPASAWTAEEVPEGYLVGYSTNRDFKDHGGVALFNKTNQEWSFTPLNGGVVQLTDINGTLFAATTQGGLYTSSDNFASYNKIFQAESGGFDLSYYQMNGHDVAISAAGSVYVDGSQAMHIDSNWLGVVPTSSNSLAGFTTKDNKSIPIQINLDW